MTDNNLLDLQRALRYFEIYKRNGSGVTDIQLAGGVLALYFTDQAKLDNFTIEVVTIGDSVIVPIKILKPLN